MVVYDVISIHDYFNMIKIASRNVTLIFPADLQLKFLMCLWFGFKVLWDTHVFCCCGGGGGCGTVSDKLLRGSDDFVWSVEFTMYAKFLLEVEFHDLKVASVNVSVLHLPFLVLGYHET